MDAETGRPLETTHALLWASWAAGSPEEGWVLFEGWGGRGLAFDPESFGQLFADCAFARRQQHEAGLLRSMERSCAFEELLPLFELGDSAAPPLPDGLEVDMKFDLRASPDGRPRGSHGKLASLVSYLGAAEVGGVMALLAAVSVFADEGGLGGLRSYLKIAGSRADKLFEASKSRPPGGAEIAVEYGAFLGTSAVRLADLAGKAASELGLPRRVQVLSFEVEPVHVVAARWLVELCGLSWACEIWPGLGGDAAKRAVDEFGGLSWRLVFFDHRGTKFHEDLAQLERPLGVLAPGAVVVADSVLRPGAPLLLWHLHTGGAFEAVTWAFMDSTPCPGEDWMTVARYGGEPGRSRPWPPASLERLSWDSDRWRRKSQDGGLRASDWSAFALHAAEELARCGVEAQPWFDPNAPPPPQEEEGAAAMDFADSSPARDPADRLEGDDDRTVGGAKLEAPDAGEEDPDGEQDGPGDDGGIADPADGSGNAEWAGDW